MSSLRFAILTAAAATSLPLLGNAQINWRKIDASLSRADHAIVYDPVLRRLILFGGRDAKGPTNDLFRWDGKTWTAFASYGVPAGRSGHTMTTSEYPFQGVLVFGGRLSNGRVTDEGWVLDGYYWRTLGPVVPRPAPRADHAMASRGQVGALLFGGLDGKGNALDDTWFYNAGKWARLSPKTVPPARSHHALVYDRVRDRFVMFGGFGRASAPLLNDTWEWDEKTKDWTLQKPAVSPPPRGRHVLVYDEYRERVLLFGGQIGQATLSDTWEWDGTNWKRLNPSTAPARRMDHAAAFDRFTSTLILSGGDSGSGLQGDTFDVYSLAPAVVKPFHGPCTTSPLFTLYNNWPWAGSDWEVVFAPLQNVKFAVLLLGVSRTRWGNIPLPLSLNGLGMRRCWLVVSPESITVWPTGSSGTAALCRVSIPAHASLVGKSIYCQGLVPEPNANPAGWVTSGALQAQIGLR